MAEAMEMPTNSTAPITIESQNANTVPTPGFNATDETIVGVGGTARNETNIPEGYVVQEQHQQEEENTEENRSVRGSTAASRGEGVPQQPVNDEDSPGDDDGNQAIYV
jgi:hypothetical protein